MRLGLYPAVFLLTLISSGAIANESLSGFSSPAFRQFEATYNASTMGMTLDLKRSLTKEADVYTLSSRGKNVLINMKESAEFRISEGRIEGIRFDSKVKALKTTKRSVRFNRVDGVIDSMKRGDWTQHQWAPHVLDRFSQQQQLRLTLMSSEKPPQTLSFTVVDGPKVSEKRWERAWRSISRRCSLCALCALGAPCATCAPCALGRASARSTLPRSPGSMTRAGTGGNR